MMRNKGISMITLVITIVVMIILLGLAYRVGTRYILTSREEEQNALVNIMSGAVERRQNINYSGIAGDASYYSGYHIASGDFNKIMSLVENGDFDYGPGLWYILDAKNAQDLGVKDAKQYLVGDLENVKEDDPHYIAVADYFTGKVYIVYFDEAVIDSNTLGQGPSGCVHKATIATCTQPSICQICGEILSSALGHDYGYGPKTEENPNGKYYPVKMTHATCTLDLKCERCGYIAEKATGHLYDTTTLEHNAEGHFNVCRNLDFNTGDIGVAQECGAIGNFSPHTKQYTIIPGNEWKHTVSCPICGFADSQEACDTRIRPNNLNVHTKYCTLCLKSIDYTHDVIKYRYVDKHKHIVYCDTCKSDLREEEHIDIEEPYGICDRCDGLMDVSGKPQVYSVTMENTTPSGENKYWAKRGNIVTVTIQTDTVLAGLPTFRVQGITINSNDVQNPESLKYVARIDTSRYNFNDGVMNIEVSNIKSLWGVRADVITETSDGRYVTYDRTLPQYEVLP